jgi:hypothetical protein
MAESSCAAKGSRPGVVQLGGFTIPAELLREILTYLPLRDLAAIRSASCEAFIIASDPLVSPYR